MELLGFIKIKVTGDFGDGNLRAVWVESDFRVYSSSET